MESPLKKQKKCPEPKGNPFPKLPDWQHSLIEARHPQESEGNTANSLKHIVVLEVLNQEPMLPVYTVLHHAESWGSLIGSNVVGTSLSLEGAKKCAIDACFDLCTQGIFDGIRVCKVWSTLMSLSSVQCFGTPGKEYLKADRKTLKHIKTLTWVQKIEFIKKHLHGVFESCAFKGGNPMISFRSPGKGRADHCIEWYFLITKHTLYTGLN